MFFFILRRLLVSIPILIASTFLMFFMVTISGDPLAELRQSNNPNAQQQMQTLERLMGLDKPFLERYFDWISGVVRGDFGINRYGQEVNALLSQAVGTTMRLVIIANVMSILLGVAVGIVSAVRQYSAIDYTSTFLAFLFFALPVFWLAVLLKEFGAIKFNDYLENPGLNTTSIVLLTIVGAVLVGALIPGSRTRTLIATLVAAVVIGGGLVIIDQTDWLMNPGFSMPVIVVMAVCGGVAAAGAFAPISNRAVLISGVLSALLGVGGSVLFSGWLDDPTVSQLFQLWLMSVALGVVVGFILGGAVDRRAAMLAGVLATFFVGAIVVTDRIISEWTPGRTFATIGPQTPNLTGDFWYRMIDYIGHQMLPSLALMLIGFATYMRYTRASMLDTLKSDYVRTAKAKGLPATQVVLRHAFRTALIPVMTVVTLSFATLIEGAVITDRVFGWSGMGTLFIEGLTDRDPYPVMGFLVVVSLSIVTLNAVADIMYAYLDPRIRR